MSIARIFLSAVLQKMGNLLPQCFPRTIWATGTAAPAAPVAPAPLIALEDTDNFIYRHFYTCISRVWEKVIPFYD